MKFKRVSTQKVDDLKVSYYMFPLLKHGEFYIAHEVKQRFNIWKFINTFTTVKFNMFLVDISVIDYVLDVRERDTAKEYRTSTIGFMDETYEKHYQQVDVDVSDVDVANAIKTQMTKMVNEKVAGLKDLSDDESKVLSTFLDAGYEFLHARRHGSTVRYTLVDIRGDTTWLVSLDVVKTKTQTYVTTVNQIVIPHDALDNIVNNLKGGK